MTAPVGGSVHYDVAGRVATLTPDRPARRNALDSAMIGRLADELDRAESAPAVVRAAKGPVFCAGMNLVALAWGERGGVTDSDRFADFVNRPTESR